MSEEQETTNSEPQETQPEQVAEETSSTSLISTSETEETESTEAVAEEVTPLTVEDISIPEGMEIPDELRDEFLTVMNDGEMTPKDRAQALIDLQAKAAQEASEAASQAFVTQQQAWQDEVKADPDIGGAKFDATIKGISRLVDQYGTDEFVQVMASTGAGNNIHVVKFFHQLAQKLNEPAPVNGAPVATQEDAASRLFPSMKG